MYAIVGITGRVGSAVGENLLAQGEQIRAIVRDSQGAARWRDRGADVAVADVHDSNALASAFEGMDGVFLMIPPNFAPAPASPSNPFRSFVWKPLLFNALIGKLARCCEPGLITTYLSVRLLVISGFLNTYPVAFTRQVERVDI